MKLHIKYFCFQGGAGCQEFQTVGPYKVKYICTDKWIQEGERGTRNSKIADVF